MVTSKDLRVGRTLYARATGAPIKLVKKRFSTINKGIFGLEETYTYWTILEPDGKKPEIHESEVIDTCRLTKPTRSQAKSFVRRYGSGMKAKDWERLERLWKQYRLKA